MKKYYVVHGNFSNAYSLLYVENESDRNALPEDAEQISRKEALRMAARERLRRKEDPAFSGFADAEIYPASADRNAIDFANPERYGYNLKNNIFERL